MGQDYESTIDLSTGQKKLRKTSDNVEDVTYNSNVAAKDAVRQYTSSSSAAVTLASGQDEVLGVVLEHDGTSSTRVMTQGVYEDYWTSDQTPGTHYHLKESTSSGSTIGTEGVSNGGSFVGIAISTRDLYVNPSLYHNRVVRKITTTANSGTFTIDARSTVVVVTASHTGNIVTLPTSPALGHIVQVAANGVSNTNKVYVRTASNSYAVNGSSAASSTSYALGGLSTGDQYRVWKFLHLGSGNWAASYGNTGGY